MDTFITFICFIIFSSSFALDCGCQKIFKLVSSHKCCRCSNIDLLFSSILLFFVYVVQIKLQFRPESICILLSSLIFYYHKKENYVLIPILFGFLLNSHIVFFTFLSIIFLLSFWKIYLKKKVIFKLIAFFLITLKHFASSQTNPEPWL